MSGTKILWLQVVIVFGIVILAIWAATEWTAWQLGFQPELGSPWWHLAGTPIYLPPAFFWWWFAYDAYAPSVFLHGAYIAASGTVVAIIAAIAMSVWRAREAKTGHHLRLGPLGNPGRGTSRRAAHARRRAARQAGARLSAP